MAFGSASNVGTTASFSAEGAYVLRLTATDGELSSFSDVTVTVNPAPPTNIAPSVDAGTAQSITLPDSATLNGTASDDGLPASPGSVTTTWSKISGPGTVAFGSASNVGTTASFSAAGAYVLRLTANDGALSNFSEMTVTVSPEPPSTGLVMEVGEATGVGSSWQTITLANTYASMVVVATVEYPSIASLPAVSRIRNAVGNSFDLRVQNPSETNLSGYSVHYFVVEEGLYNQAAHGIDMEAVKVVGSSTSRKSNWITSETRSYQGSYTNPVITGQIMTYADTQWSSFWASSNGSRNNPPNGSSFAAGKHVGEDTSTARQVETLGYVVIESGSYIASGIGIYAVVSADNINGVDNSTNGYTVPVSGLSNPNHAIVGSVAMDGNDGGWPVLLTSNPVSSSQVNVVIDEDQVRDGERRHTTEQISVIVFE